MKNFYAYALRFCLFFIWLFIDSCQHKGDPIGPTTINIGIKSLYNDIVISDRKTALGLITYDTTKRESALLFGSKNSNGILTTVKDLIYFLPAKDVVINITLTDQFFLDKISVKTSTDTKIYKLENYDFLNKNVNLTIIDGPTNTYQITKKQLTLNAELISNLNLLQAYGQNLARGGRRAANDCDNLKNLSRVILSTAACVFSIAEFFATLAAIPATAGTSLLLGGSIVFVNTMLTCTDAAKGLNALTAGECKEESNVPESISSCLTGLIPSFVKGKFSGKDGIADCIASIIDILFDKYWPPLTLKNILPSSTGGAYGDPHLQTFDGLYYDFQGHGEFIAVKSLNDNFEIQVRQEQIAPYLGRQVTMHTAIAVNTGNDKVCIYPNGLYINNKRYSISDGSIALTKGSVSTSNGLMTIVSDNEDVIKISTQSFSAGFIDYKVTLNNNRKGKVQGLLGNFDGTATNDTQLQAGMAVNSSVFSELYPAYANSWRVSQDKSLFVYSNGTSTDTYTKKDFPKSQTELDAAARQQAETICRQKGVTDEPYLSACIMDVALSGSDRYTFSAIGAQETKSMSTNFTIGKFTSFDELDLTPFGNAEIVDGALYMTRADYWKSAAVFKKYKTDITNGFETTFDFVMSDVGGIRDYRNRLGADGIAFIIQDYGSSNVPLSGGVGLGYEGLPRSLAIEFDTYNNGSYENQDDISLNTQGINPNSVNDSRTLIKAQTRPMPVMNDGKTHNVVIRYTKKSDGVYKMEVFLDKDTSPYLTADNINIQKIIGAYGTGVYVGLTAATGNAYESHVIQNWSFKLLQ